MPRFAPRSIAATCTFMATAFALATLRYYRPFLVEGPIFGPNYEEAWRWVSWVLLVCLNIAGFVLFLTVSRAKKQELILNYIFGLLFGFGLVVSGMCRVSKIMNFLTIGSVWDPSLAFVMASAVAINVFTFNYTLKKVPAPLVSKENYCIPARGKVDARLLGGAAIFGLGWGLSGLCPGPGLIVFFTMNEAILWVAALPLGMLIFDYSLKLWDRVFKGESVQKPTPLPLEQGPDTQRPDNSKEQGSEEA